MKTFPFQNEIDLDKNTPIYKYMPLEGFLYLLKYKKLMFTKLTSWDDAEEGAKFDFLKQLHKDDKHFDKSKGQFFASSFSLQTENSCFYTDDDEHQKAVSDLKNHGSESMWKAYCKKGGVRIRTTIGKMEEILKSQKNKFEVEIYKDIVQYEPTNYWDKSASSNNLISKLFIKGVSFRHESEYRFILVAKKEISENQVFFKVGRLYDFVDELLISPATSSNAWISEMLHSYAVSISIDPSSTDIIGTNNKNDRPYCRISKLYGNISERV